MTIQRLNPSPRWSDATVFNGIAHFVEVPNNTQTPMAEQIAQILAQAETTLAAIGSNKSQLLSAIIDSCLYFSCYIARTGATHGNTH